MNETSPVNRTLNTLILTNTTALILIDVQEAFRNPKLGARNNDDAESNITEILGTWRHTGLPLIHVKHDSLDPNSLLHPKAPGNQIQGAALPLPHEIVVHKRVNSAFIGTDLDELLKERQVTKLVLVGLTTDHCVSTTVRMAANLGYSVYLVGDATATYARKAHNGCDYTADQMHESALVSLHGEFATIATTEEVLAATRAFVPGHATLPAQ